MAMLFPDSEQINKLKVPPTEGEIYLLNFLTKYLDNSFEVYFQPMLDGDRPDIMIIKKHVGIIIIEVKDWKPSFYTIHKNVITGNVEWSLSKNQQKVYSPVEQVLKYKKHIYDFHLDGAVEKAVTQSNGNNQYSFVNCCVYFHEANRMDISRLASLYNNERLGLMSKDLLSKQLDTFLQIAKFNNYSESKPSKYFTDNYYKQIKKMLMPSFHELEIGKKYYYTKRQFELIKSESGNKKILGASGSGKSTILAQRAVNSYKRTVGLYDEQIDGILILTYNITLINFLKDKINNVREAFPRNKFYIDNFHSFIAKICNNLGVGSPWIKVKDKLILDPGFYEALSMVKGNIRPYSAIFIDEIQDFPKEWQRIIKDFFLIPNGEFVLFGDEKQNIYGNDLEEKKIANIIPGPWNEINETHRLTNRLSDLAFSFQKKFFKNKYDIKPINVKTNKDQYPAGNKIEQSIKYIYYNSKIDFFNSKILYRLLNEIGESPYPNPNDIAILGSEKELLREIEFKIRKEKKIKTAVTFLRQEGYKELEKKHKGVQSSNFKEDLRKVERNIKTHFRMNPGTMKLSTIHSFKGWEIYHLILLISEPSSQQNPQESLDELVYTGMTRSRANLTIINIGNDKYHQFFQLHI